ncbi:MAG: CotH kinase family protein [Lachnospiraceae bacterium]|nr:CotH kinase family protein [Lachnospiraceae bacterium]
MDLKRGTIIFFAVASCVVVVLSVILYFTDHDDVVVQRSADYYEMLSDDVPDSDALGAISEDFTTDIESFESNLPLVVLELDSELPEYKTFVGEEEIVYEDVDPWTTGTISLYENSDGYNRLTDEAAETSTINIKKRGHTSINFDKAQYYIKLTDENGEENPLDVFGMGADDSWILNGSMADKSMIRNYLAYRVSAQIMEYAPRCTFCEMFTFENGEYVYQGVYLMTESVKRSENRVNIDESKKGETYTSYLVRRDRYTSFDTMLDTYARLTGANDEWIGVKYPGESKQSEANLAYIQEDFSNIEKVLMSDNETVFKTYTRYIDSDTFADYFLINEYFGNYDAGEHSTYMYKNSGETLKIGPVWDFDQAMNNSVYDETDPNSLAMQEKAFFSNLVKDTEFVNLLKTRYAYLRENYLNDTYIFSIIEETKTYLESARQREWYRWAEDYLDEEGVVPGSYALGDYEKEGVTISRYNDSYDQEIYNIKTYLSIHGEVIESELTSLLEDCTVTTGLKGEMVLIFIITCCLFVVPSILINRK